MKQTLGTPSERQLHGHPKACPSWAPADGGHSGMSQVTVRSGALCQHITWLDSFPPRSDSRGRCPVASPKSSGTHEKPGIQGRSSFLNLNVGHWC